MNHRDLTFIDLFSGAGGWSVGFKSAGFKHISMYDNNKSACRTAKENFGDIVHCVDLRKKRRIDYSKS